MSNQTKSVLRLLLGGVARCLFLIAVFLFIWGGGLYTRLTGADRIASEMGGIALSFVFGGLGAATKAAQRRVDGSVDGKAKEA